MIRAVIAPRNDNESNPALSFIWFVGAEKPQGKARDREDALASTRDACATQNPAATRDAGKDRSPSPCGLGNFSIFQSNTATGSSEPFFFQVVHVEPMMHYPVARDELPDVILHELLEVQWQIAQV